MANKNKKSKEPIYRTPDGVRWRFIEAETIPTSVFSGCWLMARVRDGHRLYVQTKNLTREK